MSDEERLPSSGAPRKLTVEEITYLSNMGRLFHSAPGYRAIQDALDAAIKAVRRHRADGVAWPDITRALRIPQEELLHRMRETTDKPLPAPPPPTAPTRISDRLPRDPLHPPTSRPRPPPSELMNQTWSASISAHSLQNSAFSADIPRRATTRESSPQRAPPRACCSSPAIHAPDATTSAPRPRASGRPSPRVTCD